MALQGSVRAGEEDLVCFREILDLLRISSLSPQLSIFLRLTSMGTHNSGNLGST